MRRGRTASLRMSRRLVIPSVIVFVIATGFILFLSPHNMRRVQAGFLGVISPFLKTGSSVDKKYRDFREGLKTLDQLEEDNKRLTVATKEQGIVKGERASSGSSPSIGLNFLAKQANLKSGSNIYSSGAGGVFPSGVLIGQVKEFKMRELDGHASVVPAVDLTTLEDVFVVVGDNK